MNFKFPTITDKLKAPIYRKEQIKGANFNYKKLNKIQEAYLKTIDEEEQEKFERSEK